MEKNKDEILTSVKLPGKLFEDFRIMSVKSKMTFKKLAERAVFLYVTNIEFKKQVDNQLDTNYTGSL